MNENPVHDRFTTARSLDREEHKARKAELAKTLGAVVLSARKAMGWTQEDVGYAVGVTSEFYARVERGDALPGLKTAIRLADVYRLEFDMLLGFKPLDLSHLTPDPQTRFFRKLVRRVLSMSPRTRRVLAPILDRLLPL